MRLPFVLSDRDWQSVAPPQSEGLGQRRDRSDEETLTITILRRLEFQTRWACEEAVVNRNLIVAIGMTMIAINGAAVLDLVLKVLRLK